MSNDLTRFDTSLLSDSRPHHPPINASPQLVVACAITFLVGAVLQLNKLAVLDGAGRQFSQETYASKSGFLVPFAICKALCNLVVGALADRYGRKRIAILGWGVGLIAPTLVLSAPTTPDGWPAVVSSAAFLGMQQGLVWSCMILAMMDLCGADARGFASGLNETVGYTAIAIFAQVYGGIERRTVECAWVDSVEDFSRPPDCVEAVGIKAHCAGPDDWTPYCAGSCVCTGYTGEPFRLQLALMITGVAITAGVLRETLGFVGSDAGRGRGGNVGKSGGRGVSGRAPGGEIMMSHLKDSTFAHLEGFSEDDQTDMLGNGGANGARRQAAALSLGGRTTANDAASSGEAGYSADSGDSEGDYYDNEGEDTIGGVSTAPIAGAGADETLKDAFVRTSFSNRSLAVVCVAGFCANFETGMAWGLIASWARDGLGIGGRERDFFTGCYSFLKGFSQLLAGLISDRIGRRAPMAAGLIGGAAAMLIAAVGAGFHGRVLIGIAPANDVKSLQFGYLVLSGVLLGLSTGLMYPVLAAAAADHAPAGRLAGTIGTVRFWRDLGYAMGMPVAALADAASPETALIMVAILMACAGCAVMALYKEVMRLELRDKGAGGSGRRRSEGSGRSKESPRSAGLSASGDQVAVTVGLSEAEQRGGHSSGDRNGRT